MNAQRRNVARITAGVLAMAGALTTPLAAQDPGYLFGPPKGSLVVKAAMNLPNAGSDLFDFTREQLTVDKGDFRGFGVGGDINIDLSGRAVLVLGATHSESSTFSEFRDWVGDDDLPIEQVTDFATTSLTAGLRFYMQERGRSISSLAWIPTRVNPYVGAGVGMVDHRFEQYGEFVDEETLDIFDDNFKSTGNSALFYGAAGIDAGLSSRVFFNGEARYSHANGRLSKDFVGFDDLDLSGLQFSVGVGFRF